MSYAEHHEQPDTQWKRIHMDILGVAALVSTDLQHVLP